MTERYVLAISKIVQFEVVPEYGHRMYILTSDGDIYTRGANERDWQPVHQGSRLCLVGEPPDDGEDDGGNDGEDDDGEGTS